MRPLLKTRRIQQIDEATAQDEGDQDQSLPCDFPHAFTPNPGAQATIFSEFFSLKPNKPHPLTQHDSRKVIFYRGGINCVAGDTLINNTPIRDLVGVSIEVDTLMGKIKALPADKKGKALIYKVTTRSGYSIRVTARHRFLVPNHPCWVELQDLSVGSIVAVRDKCDPFDHKDDCLLDLRRGDELPLPFLIFAQDKLAQLCNKLEHPQHFALLGLDRNSCHLHALTLHETGAFPGSFQDRHRNPWPKLSHFRPSGVDTQIHLQWTSLVKNDIFYKPIQFDGLPQTSSSRNQDTSHVFDPEYSSLCSKLTSRFTDKLLFFHLANKGKENETAVWDEIVSIEPEGVEDFYDMHVPFANHYFANGFVNHNSGKSFSGAAFIAANAQKDPNARQLITANSYGQLKTSSLVALADFCKLFRIPLDPVADVPMDESTWADLTSKRIADARFCTLFGAPVLVLSAEAFTGRTSNSKEVGRGLQIRAFWADEFAYADESAFTTIMGRLGRGPGFLPGIGLITSSINKNNPYNWIYDLFDAPNRDEDKQLYFQSVQGSSKENIHADADYVGSMAATLTEELIKIELEGEYASVTKGTIYNTFSRAIHSLSGQDASLLTYSPNHAIYLSFDFNHSPACAIAAQLVEGELRIIKEWYLDNSDTFELSANVCQWIMTQWAGRNNVRDCHIFGDASGNQKTANSRKTNWQIVWDALNSHGIPASKQYKKANPSLIDSINALKIALKADKIFVNACECPELIKDLETLRWLDGKAEIDKRDIKRSHLQDTLRYMVWGIWPYHGGSGPRQVLTPISGVVI